MAPEVQSKIKTSIHHKIVLFYAIMVGSSFFAIALLSLAGIKNISAYQFDSNPKACNPIYFENYDIATKLAVSEARIDEVRVDAKTIPTNFDNLGERLTVLEVWRELLWREGINPYDCGGFLGFTNGDGQAVILDVSKMADHVRLANILDYEYYGQTDPVQAKEELLTWVFGDVDQLLEKVDRLFAIYEEQSGAAARYLASLPEAANYTYVERGIDLSELASGSADSVSPLTAGEYENAMEFQKTSAENCTFRFSYEQAGDLPLVYVWTPREGNLGEITVQAGNLSPLVLTHGGGITVQFSKANMSSYKPNIGERVLLSCNSSGDAGEAVFGWRPNQQYSYYKFKMNVSLEGKSLRVAIQEEEDGGAAVSGFQAGLIRDLSAGGNKAVPLKTIVIPYLSGEPVHYVRDQGIFVSNIIDWTVSQASLKGTMRGHSVASRYEYANNSRDESLARERPALKEVLYITASPELAEVLPTVPGEPSPYHDELADRIFFDEWGGAMTWDELKNRVKFFKQAGLERLALIVHDWAGDLGESDNYSPNREKLNTGADSADRVQDIQEISGLVKGIDGLFALHNSYQFIGPKFNNGDPDWALANVVLPETGNPATEGYRDVKPFIKKILAREYEPAIHDKYGTTSSFEDVTAGEFPWYYKRLDHDVTASQSAQFTANLSGAEELMTYLREIHGGPVFSEGRAHYSWGGKVDGVEAENGTAFHGAEWNTNALLLDFDLLKLHSLQANFGMGYPERWFDWGNTKSTHPPRGLDCVEMSMEEQDRYRAQEIAFGHLGYFTTQNVVKSNYPLREYNLLRDFQRHYANVPPRDIRYEINGQLEPASRAVVLGPLEKARIQYTNGLTVWVNFSKENWQLNIPDQGEITLPSFGFFASAQDQEGEPMVYTAVVGNDSSGRDLIGDYIHYLPKDERLEYYFADARTDYPDLTSGQTSCDEQNYELEGTIAGEGSSAVQMWLEQRYGMNDQDTDKVQALAIRDPEIHANTTGTAVTMGPITTNGIVRVNILNKDSICPDLEVIDLAYPESRISRTHRIDLKEIIPNFSATNLALKAYGYADLDDSEYDLMTNVEYTLNDSVVEFKEIDDQDPYRQARIYRIFSADCDSG